MFIKGGTVKVTGGAIDSNNALASSGGGIYVAAGSLTMTGKYLVTQNKAPNGNGGGMKIDGGKVTLSTGSIKSNNSGASGGGIYNSAGSLTIQKDVQIVTNTAKTDGGGMCLLVGSTTTFVGNAAAGNPACTIAGNAAGTGNGVYRQVVAGVPAVINNWPGVIDKNDPRGQPVPGQ